MIFLQMKIFPLRHRRGNLRPKRISLTLEKFVIKLRERDCAFGGPSSEARVFVWVEIEHFDHRHFSEKLMGVRHFYQRYFAHSLISFYWGFSKQFTKVLMSNRP